MITKSIEFNIPTIQELYDSLPDECKDKYVKIYSDDKLALSTFQALQFFYNKILAMLVKDSNTGNKPRISMSLFQTSGHQSICDFNTSDMSLPDSNSYNWNLQNTSRWIFAGGLLYDASSNTFSIHT
jgi:hypothetical protein